MADIHFEIFDNADFGNKNLRFSEAPAKEQRDFLKQKYSFESSKRIQGAAGRKDITNERKRNCV